MNFLIHLNCTGLLVQMVNFAILFQISITTFMRVSSIFCLKMKKISKHLNCKYEKEFFFLYQLFLFFRHLYKQNNWNVSNIIFCYYKSLCVIFYAG